MAVFSVFMCIYVYYLLDMGVLCPQCTSQMDRKGFLKRFGLGAVGAVAAPCAVSKQVSKHGVNSRRGLIKTDCTLYTGKESMTVKELAERLTKNPTPVYESKHYRQSAIWVRS